MMIKNRKIKMMTIPDFFKKLSICLLAFIVQGSFSSQWSSNPDYLKKNYSQVRNFEHYLFSNFFEDEEDEKFTDLRTHSVLIIKDGKIIYEKYSRGHDKNRPQKLWSISKSITQLLVAIAVKEKKISPEDNLCPYFKDYELQFDCNQVSIKDLLGMSSGIHWRESLSQPFQSSVFNMIYNQTGYQDSTSFILSHPLIKEPGSSWHYSSADTNLLMSILSKVYSPEDYSSLPWTKLFNRLGITSAYWDKDQKGVFYGCCSLYLTARDLARIGQLILQKGKVAGVNFFSDDWMEKYIYSIPPSFLKDPTLVIEQFVPGFQWVINKPSQYGRVTVPKALLNAPDDLLVAKGHAGQFLFIIPSMNTIFIRTGDTAGHYLDINAMVAMALNIIRGGVYVHPIRKHPVPFGIGKEYSIPRKYSSNRIQLFNNFVAKEMCSCVFIEKEEEKTCLDNISLRFDSNPSVSISKKQKTVKNLFFYDFSS